MTHPGLEMASQSIAHSHPHDRPDTLLVNLVTFDRERSKSGMPNITEKTEWITNDRLMIHKKKLHVRDGDDLYEVVDLRDMDKHTGHNVVRATRWKD